ncbi:hypothetical protein [Streptomyces sp. NPDC005408]|uniref:hypothetical protein n=1 Tax=Streptomyces sp. NPDC005408 TaxID=3155341 RepID=UPI0033AD50C6
MTWRWLPYAGAATYPLYLLHQNIGWELIRVLEPRVPAYALVGLLVGVMLLTAYLVHRLVERPLARPLRRRLDKALADARR